MRRTLQTEDRMGNIQIQMAEFTGTCNIIPERDKLLSGNKGDEGTRFLHKATRRDNTNNKGNSLGRTCSEGNQSFPLQSGQPSSQNPALLMARRIETKSFSYS